VNSRDIASDTVILVGMSGSLEVPVQYVAFVAEASLVALLKGDIANSRRNVSQLASRASCP
jgi:hypothetical protein